jgi:predicted nucleic acid-binding protein
VSLPDLLLAAVAERRGVTLLHYDADFDLVAEITGQAARWIVPRGSLVMLGHSTLVTRDEAFRELPGLLTLW